MERSRRDILECTEEEKRIDEQLAALPGIEETLKRYRDAGVEEKLGHRSLIVKEEGILASISEKLTEFSGACAELERLQPLQLQELATENIASLPSIADSGDDGRLIRRKASGGSDPRRTGNPGIPSRAVVGG